MLLRGLDYWSAALFAIMPIPIFTASSASRTMIGSRNPTVIQKAVHAMYMRPRDMLKVGITYLQDGVWNGEQIIPTNWVDEV